MAQSTAPFLKEGTHIGVYEIKDVIRFDNFNITYRAWNEHLNSMVAMMEYFPSDLVLRDPDETAIKPKSNQNPAEFQYGLDQFENQADQLEDIKHQSLAGVHNVLHFNETAYLVMDLVDGISLANQKEHSAAVTEDELTAWLRSLLSALQALHEKKIVHGDIHPSNILLEKSRNPVLINFSSARLAFSAHHNKLTEVLRKGYTPPELYEPDNLPNPSSDLYSLGATLYHSITHTDPMSPIEREQALNNQSPDPLQTELEASAPALNKVLLKSITWMLQLNTNDRPQSAIEVLTMLDENLEEASEINMDSDLKAGENETDTGQSRNVLFFGGIFVILLLLTAGIWYSQKDKRTETTASVTDDQTSKAVQTKKGTVEVSKPEPGKPLPVAKRDLPSDQPPPPETSPPEIEKITEEPGPSVEKASPSDAPSESIPELPAETKKVEQPQSESLPVNNKDKNEQIEQHLTTAQEHVEALRLSTPPDNNAYQQYLGVLELDPENPEAKKGLQNIVDIYAWFIQSEIQKKNYKAAHTYLARAKKIIPDDPELLRLRQILATKDY